MQQRPRRAHAPTTPAASLTKVVTRGRDPSAHARGKLKGMGAQPNGRTERQAAADRLWQHGLHEDNVRYQQGNLFLVAQSLLAVAYSTILTSGHDAQPARVIAAFGIALTAIWVYVGHRHRRYSAALQQRIKSVVPEYAETSAICPPRGIGTTPVLVYVLPSLAAIMWAVLLLIT